MKHGRRPPAAIPAVADTASEPPAEPPVLPAKKISHKPMPVAPQMWHLSQSIDYSLSMNRSLLDYASRNRERLLFNISSTGMDLGRSMSPVNGEYAAPFAYPGQLKRVTFETPRTVPPGEVKAQVRAEMTRQ